MDNQWRTEGKKRRNNRTSGETKWKTRENRTDTEKAKRAGGSKQRGGEM